MVIKQYRSIIMKTTKQCVLFFNTVTTGTWANCVVYKNPVTKCTTWLHYGTVKELATSQMIKYTVIRV